MRSLGRRLVQGRRVTLQGQVDRADLPERQARRGRVPGPARLHEVPGPRQLRRLRRRRRRPVHGRERRGVRLLRRQEARAPLQGRQIRAIPRVPRQGRVLAARPPGLVRHDASPSKNDPCKVQGASACAEDSEGDARLSRRQVRPLPVLPRARGLLLEGRRSRVRRDAVARAGRVRAPRLRRVLGRRTERAHLPGRALHEGDAPAARAARSIAGGRGGIDCK